MIMVQRILVKHVPALASLKLKVVQHVQHRNSAEMAEESCVITIGAIDADPASTAGVITIMEELHHYVPANGAKCSPIICNGDQLSV